MTSSNGDDRMPARRPRPINPVLKIALELGPLLLFFLANARFGIFVGTGIFMAAVLAALATSYALTRHLPIMAIVSAGVVVVFGGMTLVLHDDTFIKVKPTIIYTMFGAILFVGLATGRPFLEAVLEGAFHLTEEGWKILTWRWAFFFLALAVLNEIVWRSVTTDTWVAFKTFGFLPITILFALAQTPVFLRYQVKK